jgi:monoamine oxidase
MRSQEVITTRLPGEPESCWTATAPKTEYPKLVESRTADVVVVGAGIVGVTAAYLLSEAGLPVTLLEARHIGRQVTGRSTAKITTQHSLIYRHLIETFDLETAQLYADATLARTKSGNGSRNSLSIAPSRRRTPTFTAAAHRGSGTSRLKPMLRVKLGLMQTCSTARHCPIQPPARCDLEARHNSTRRNI